MDGLNSHIDPFTFAAVGCWQHFRLFTYWVLVSTWKASLISVEKYKHMKIQIYPIFIFKIALGNQHKQMKLSRWGQTWHFFWWKLGQLFADILGIWTPLTNATSGCVPQKNKEKITKQDTFQIIVPNIKWNLKAKGLICCLFVRLQWVCSCVIRRNKQNIHLKI